MKENIIVPINTSIIMVLIFGVIFFGGISIYILPGTIYQEYIQIGGVILFTIFGGFAIMSGYAIFTLKKYELTDDELIVFSIFNKITSIIFLSDITGYTEIAKRNKSGTWSDLTLYTSYGDKVVISSNTVNNFPALRKKLIHNKKRDEFSEKLWKYRSERKYGVGFIIISILILLGLYSSYNNSTELNLKEIVCTVDSVYMQKIGRSSEELRFKTKEFNLFTFTVASSHKNTINNLSLLSKVQKGDTILLTIEADEQSKKISKTQELGFWDKTYNYGFINFYGVKKGIHDFSYTNKQEIIKNDHEDTLIILYIFIGITIFLFVVSIYLLSKKKPIKSC